MNPTDLLTVHEVASDLGRSATMVRNYCRFHGLPSTRNGGRIFVTRRDLDAWKADPGVAAMLQAGAFINRGRLATAEVGGAAR